MTSNSLCAIKPNQSKQSNKIPWGNAWWKLYKNAICCFELILEASHNKTLAVRTLTFHLTNYPSKTNKTCCTLLEKWMRSNWRYSHGPLRTSVSQPAITYIHQLWMQSRGLARSDRRSEQIAREGERVRELCLISMTWMVKVFAIGPGDRGSVPCRVIPKTQNGICFLFA